MRHFHLSVFLLLLFFVTQPKESQFIQKKSSRNPSSDLTKDILQTPNLIQNSANRITLIYKNSDLQFEVSLTEPEEVQKLFKKMAALDHIPFKYIEGGCSARAHEMAMILEKEQIFVGKYFVIGNLKVPTNLLSEGVVQWSEHIAPFVYTKIDQQIIPMVIDPSLFPKAVSAEEWLNKLLQNKPKSEFQIFITSRFYFSPRSLMQGPSYQYEEWEIEKTQIDLENYTEELKKSKN